MSESINAEVDQALRMLSLITSYSNKKRLKRLNCTEFVDASKAKLVPILNGITCMTYGRWKLQVKGALLS